MKRTFRDDDRHASISSQTWSDFPTLSLRGRTFLTITCATGMAIDQPCKSNNSVPSNVLSLLFYFLFFLLRYLWIASLHYQLLKNSNTSTISIREISSNFSFLLHTYIYWILLHFASQIERSKNLLHLQLLFSFKKKTFKKSTWFTLDPPIIVFYRKFWHNFTLCSSDPDRAIFVPFKKVILAWCTTWPEPPSNRTTPRILLSQFTMWIEKQRNYGESSNIRSVSAGFNE